MPAPVMTQIEPCPLEKFLLCHHYYLDPDASGTAAHGESSSLINWLIYEYFLVAQGLGN